MVDVEIKIIIIFEQNVWNCIEMMIKQYLEYVKNHFYTLL